MRSLYAPVRSFFEAERERPQWRGVLVVGATAVLPVVASLVLASLTPQGHRPVVSMATGAGTVDAPAHRVRDLVLLLVIPFAFWLLYAALAYGITAVFGGEGGFARHATLFAWGHAPELVVETVWFAAFVANVAGTTPPGDPAETEAWTAAVFSGPAMAAVDVLYPVAVLVSVGLLAVATSVGRRVSLRQAVVAVLPVLVVEVGTYYALVVA